LNQGCSEEKAKKAFLSVKPGFLINSTPSEFPPCLYFPLQYQPVIGFFLAGEISWQLAFSDILVESHKST